MPSRRLPRVLGVAAAVWIAAIPTAYSMNAKLGEQPGFWNEYKLPVFVTWLLAAGVLFSLIAISDLRKEQRDDGQIGLLTAYPAIDSIQPLVASAVSKTIENVADTRIGTFLVGFKFMVSVMSETQSSGSVVKRLMNKWAGHFVLGAGLAIWVGSSTFANSGTALAAGLALGVLPMTYGLVTLLNDSSRVNPTQARLKGLDVASSLTLHNEGLWAIVPSLLHLPVADRRLLAEALGVQEAAEQGASCKSDPGLQCRTTRWEDTSYALSRRVVSVGGTPLGVVTAWTVRDPPDGMEQEVAVAAAVVSIGKLVASLMAELRPTLGKLPLE